MSRRNMAAILTIHIDNVSDRLIEITSPLSSVGQITPASIVEYKKWFDIREGLMVMLAEYGEKCAPRFLTANSTFKLTDRMVTLFGNQVQNLRTNEGVSTDRLVHHDAAYVYLSDQLKQVKVKRAAQSAKTPEVWKMPVKGAVR